MKFSIFPLLLLYFGTPLIGQVDVYTLSAEEIAEAFIAASGGREARLAIKSMHVTGKMELGGVKYPMTSTTAEGNKSRLDVELIHSPFAQGYDGSTVRQVSPSLGAGGPTILTDREYLNYHDAPFLTEFIDSQKRGYTLTLVEGLKIGSTVAPGVRVTNVSGSDRTFYFNPRNMLPIKVVYVGRGGVIRDKEVEVFFDHYENIGGLLVPMFMLERVDGKVVAETTYDSVEFNSSIAPGLFELADY